MIDTITTGGRTNVPLQVGVVIEAAIMTGGTETMVVEAFLPLDALLAVTD